MKKLLLLTLTLSLVLLAACGQQGDANTTSQTISYLESSNAVSFSKTPSTQITSTYTSKSEEKKFTDLNIPTEDIIEMRVYCAQREPVIVKDKETIRAITEYFNNRIFYYVPKEESEPLIAGMSWSVRWIDRNEKEIKLRNYGEYYYYNDVRLKSAGFNEIDFINKVTNADW